MNLNLSIQQVKLAYLLILLLTILRAVSQFCFKLASTSISPNQPLAAFTQPTLWMGVLIYIISFPLLLQIHKMLPLNRVAPLLSTALVWAALLGIFFLSEALDLYRIIGIGLIIVGTMVIGRTEREA